MSNLNEFNIMITVSYVHPYAYEFNVNCEKKTITRLFNNIEYVGELDERGINILKEYYNKTLKDVDLKYICSTIPIKIIVTINIPFSDRQETFEILFKEVKKYKNFKIIISERTFDIITTNDRLVIEYREIGFTYRKVISNNEYSFLKDYHDNKIKLVSSHDPPNIIIESQVEINNLTHIYLIKLSKLTKEEFLEEENKSLKETIEKLTAKIEELKK